jgi:hypothetical protein
VMATQKNQADVRTRFRAALRRITSGIHLLIVRRGDVALCAGQMWFTGTDRQRMFLIIYRPVRKGFMREARPAQYAVISNAWENTESEPFDMRRDGDVKVMEEFLVKYDWSAVLA